MHALKQLVRSVVLEKGDKPRRARMSLERQEQGKYFFATIQDSEGNEYEVCFSGG